MLKFWQVGFDGVSIRDLGKAMGIGQTSIYAAFGDKASLYYAAIERFESAEKVLDMSAFQASPSIDEGIAATLENAIKRYTSARRPAGCMILTGRVADKPDQRKIVLKLRERRGRQLASIAQGLSRWVGQGEATYASQYLLISMMGLSTRAVDGATAAELRRTIPFIVAGALAACASHQHE